MSIDKLSEEKRAAVLAAIDSGITSAAEIARIAGVTRETAKRLLVEAGKYKGREKRPPRVEEIPGEDASAEEVQAYLDAHGSFRRSRPGEEEGVHVITVDPERIARGWELTPAQMALLQG